MLGNRVFHPLRTAAADSRKQLAEFIAQRSEPVTFTSEAYAGMGRRDRWLYVELERPTAQTAHVVIDIPEDAMRFFEQSVLDDAERDNAWVAHHKDELRRRFAILLAQRIVVAPLDERSRRHLQALYGDFFGVMGLAEGLMSGPGAYPVPLVADLLERAAQLVPAGVRKRDRAKFFELRGRLRRDSGDLRGAQRDQETALALWPVRQ